MKKFFTLFAAALMVLSASAVNLTKAPKLAARQGVQLVDRSQARAHKAVFPHKESSVKALAPAHTQDLSFSFNDCQAWGYDSYFGDGSWDLDLYNGDDYVGTLAIMGDCDATHICGTYDLANAVDGYPGALFVRAAGDTIEAISGSFVVSFVSSTNDIPTYHVAGSLVCADAVVALDNDFPVTYAIDYMSYVYYLYGYSTSPSLITLQDDPNAPTQDAYEFDEETDVNISYTSAEATLEYDDQYQANYGIVDIYVDKNDGSDELALEAVYTTPLVGGVMPDGVYQINDTEAEGTFLASPGFDGQYVYPCFYGLLGNTGGISNIWFLVSGTVTISNNGKKIVVAATNSNGNTINFTYTDGAQGIENATCVKASKALVDDQVRIVRGAKTFNVLGAEL